MTPRCPACDAEIVGEPAECPDCGLSFQGWAAEQPEAASAEEFEAFLDARELEEDPDVAANDDGRGDDPGAPSRESAPAFDGPRTLPDPAAVGIHAFAEAFVARLAECVPHAALDLGLHPHDPVALARDADEAAWERLAGEALASLDAWESAGPRDIHDRIDARVLRSFCRGAPDAECVPAAEFAAAFQVTTRAFRLADVECCAVADRAAAAAVLLAQLAEEVQSTSEDPGEISRSTALALADCWADDAASLRGFESRWRGLDRETRRRLVSVAAQAADALDGAAARMRTIVAPSATARAGIGAAALSSLLRDGHGLPFGARGAYVAALEALRAAEAAYAAPAAGDERMELVPFVPDIEYVRSLYAGCGAWLRDVPAEPGLRVSLSIPSPRSSPHAGMLVDGGPFDATRSGAVLLGTSSDGRAAEDESGRLRRRHLLAHETYPGHRLEALMRHRACVVRRLADDRMAVEGWAVYAEDLVHESGACANGPLDRDQVTEGRRWRAQFALGEILFATNAAPEDEILRLLGCPVPNDAQRAWLASAYSRQGSALTYVVGHAEIRRLRALVEAHDGASFDLRDFHARLLAEGPIPPRWVAEAWGLDAEPAARAAP